MQIKTWIEEHRIMESKPYCVSWLSLHEGGGFYIYGRRPDDAAGRKRLCPEQDKFYATPEEAWRAWREELLRWAKTEEDNAARFRETVKKWYLYED